MPHDFEIFYRSIKCTYVKKTALRSREIDTKRTSYKKLVLSFYSDIITIIGELYFIRLVVSPVFGLIHRIATGYISLADLES